jgi:hypothetical protein
MMLINMMTTNAGPRTDRRHTRKIPELIPHRYRQSVKRNEKARDNDEPIRSRSLDSTLIRDIQTDHRRKQSEAGGDRKRGQDHLGRPAQQRGPNKR